jgi:hypothetical protein
VFENPFRSPGRWYRANLHAHTTASDGDISPEGAAKLYRKAGYHVLALTDHWFVGELPREHDDFLIIPGAEFDVGKPAQATSYHVVGLNLRTRGKIDRATLPGPQEAIDFINGEGGAAFVAHPYWSGLMASDMLGLKGSFAVEVYNTGCDLEILRGYSMVHWDDMLTLGGDVGAVAVDDGHRHQVDHGGAWTMIRAEELTLPAIMEALARGRYYSSLGPELLDLTVEAGKLRVTTSPVTSIALVSSPARGGRAFTAPGETITTAEFDLPTARYCRVEAIDAKGKTLWSNPVLLDGA